MDVIEFVHKQESVVADRESMAMALGKSSIQ